MKILLATKTFIPITHGPAKFAHFVLDINQRYPKHEVRILTEGVEVAIPNLIYKITTNYRRPFGAFWPIFDNFLYAKKIAQIRADYAFDILLVNNAIQGSWSRLKLPASVKVVGMLNDDDYLSENISTIRLDRMWLVNFHRKYIEKFAVKKLDKTITNSSYLKNKVLQTYSVPEKKVAHLYKSIDFAKINYQPIKSIEYNQTIKILFVKSDYPRGGLKILMEALTTLTNFKFQLTIIGPKRNQRSIIFNYLNNAPNLELNLLGPQSQEKVFAAFNEHDIFCVPSYKEALGVANIEALAAGIPVVSTRVGGIPEVLDRSKNGWLCEAGNLKSLAEAIQDCITKKIERKEKSERGRRFVMDNFGHEQMLDKLIKMLEQL